MAPEAAEYITERGGRLFLWQESVNADWATDQKAFDDPGARITFTPIWVGGVEVMLADDLDRPETLRIHIDRFLHRLHIEWDGQRWGWRGGADASASGSY